MSLRLALKEAARQDLTVSQRAILKAQLLEQQIGLVAALRDERYEPTGECPNCEYKMKPVEILDGFLAIVDNFTTKCPKCGVRFQPKLICFGDGTRMELPFFCGVQARERLLKSAHMSPAQIAREFPGEYRAAVIHYGTLSALFQSVGKCYEHTELEEWQVKVMPFLGKMPDTVIAKCIGVSDDVINKLRRKSNIDAYNKRKALQEAGHL